MDPNNPDPVAVYQHIYNRLLECKTTGEKMPTAEASYSFAQLMVACSQLISHNERLRQSVALSDKLIEELEIEMTVKDIELFSFYNQTGENPE